MVATRGQASEVDGQQDDLGNATDSCTFGSSASTARRSQMRIFVLITSPAWRNPAG